MPRPRNLLLVFGVGAGAAYFVASRRGRSGATLQTPGMQNIGDRWSSGGGAEGHTPAMATPRGTIPRILTGQTDRRAKKARRFQRCAWSACRA
ncbi:hypothetical protein ANO11243_044940 [Dothideomycetidae sp. 11243]|nr:hypothetical protein ANO11243_044940 [fungal sp. No.11243]